jgi:hypothetical protein
MKSLSFWELSYVQLFVVFSLAAIPVLAQDVPFTFEKGLIIVKATAFKDSPVEAVIATGSPSSSVSMDYVLRNKITPGFAVNPKGQNLTVVDVPRIIVGDASPVSLPMNGGSLANVYTRAGREITMILGADYFKGKILQIDFKSRVIRFLKDAPLDYKAAMSQPPDKTFVFRMEQQGETFLGQPVTLPVVNGAIVSGNKVRSLLETLIPYPISVSADATKEFSLGSVPAKGASQVGKLDSFSFAGLEIPNIPTQFVGKGAGFDSNVRDYGAIIGVAVLQNYRATFDWKEKVIVLERSN